MGELRLNDPRIDAGVLALDGIDAEQPATVDAIQAFADELDEIAWGLQDEVLSGSKSDADYLAAFGRSRAATSLWFAFNPDPAVSVLESVYEAQAATDPDTVRRFVYSVMNS